MLIGDPWDSLDEASPTPTQASELERRLNTFENDLAEAVTWDHLKAELAARAPEGFSPL